MIGIDDRIIAAIKASPKDGMTGGELWKALGFWRSLGLYPALFRLERHGKLKSAWVDGPYPRRRLYHLVSLRPVRRPLRTLP